MELELPYIDWREPWIPLKIAEIPEGEMLLLKVKTFSTESKQYFWKAALDTVHE